MRVQIRTWGGDNIKLCDHITISGELNDDNFPECEYKDTLHIYCRECNTTHDVVIAIN